MNIEIRSYIGKYLPEMIEIWNEVVEEGIAFPQEERLNEVTGANFSESRATAGLRSTLTGRRSWVCTFSTQTMWDGADIFATPALR